MIIQESLFSTEDTTDLSASDEWYTPKSKIDLVIEVFGEIELDPTAAPNNPVGATYYITQSDNCLTTDWSIEDDKFHYIPKKIYMNPPYSRPELFLGRLREYLSRYPDASAITLTKEGTLFNVSTQKLFKLGCRTICLPEGRIKFFNPCKQSNSPNFDTVWGYWGDTQYLDKFIEVFKNQGLVLKLD
jgi:phage N-6-adenine-methyltransferase